MARSAGPAAARLHRARQRHAAVAQRMPRALQLQRSPRLEQRQAVKEGGHIGARLQHLLRSPAGERLGEQGRQQLANAATGRHPLAWKAGGRPAAALAGPRRTWTGGRRGLARRSAIRGAERPRRPPPALREGRRRRRAAHAAATSPARSSGLTTWPPGRGSRPTARHAPLVAPLPPQLSSTGVCRGGRRSWRRTTGGGAGGGSCSGFTGSGRFQLTDGLPCVCVQGDAGVLGCSGAKSGIEATAGASSPSVWGEISIEGDVSVTMSSNDRCKGRRWRRNGRKAPARTAVKGDERCGLRIAAAQFDGRTALDTMASGLFNSYEVEYATKSTELAGKIERATALPAGDAKLPPPGTQRRALEIGERRASHSHSRPCLLPQIKRAMRHESWRRPCGTSSSW